MFRKGKRMTHEQNSRQLTIGMLRAGLKLSKEYMDCQSMASVD